MSDFWKVFPLPSMKLPDIVEQYSGCSSMDNRGIYALYMPAATKTLVVVVNPFNNREIAAAQLERQFQIAVRSQDQPKADNSEVSCKVSCFTSQQFPGLKPC